MRLISVLLLLMVAATAYGTIFGSGVKFVTDLHKKLRRRYDERFERRLSPVIFGECSRIIIDDDLDTVLIID